VAGGGALMDVWLVQLSSIFAGLGMLAFGSAALWLALRPSRKMAALMPSRAALVAVVAGLGVWSAVWYIAGPGNWATLLADTLRNLVFLGWLGASFTVEGNGLRARSIRLMLLTLVMINLIPALLGGAALLNIAMTANPIATAWLKPSLSLVDMLTASAGLLLVENFSRHRSAGVRGPVLLVAGGIAALWAYTLNIHLLGWLSGSTPVTLTLLEPLVTLLVLPTFILVALDTGRERMRLSRSIAVRTLAIVALATYLMVIALTGALARLLGGDYGQLVQGVFLILALGLGGLLFASTRARAWLSVMISKHFFEHRYDYRAEWMRFTATLEGQAQGAEPTFRRIARALAELAGSPGALLMTADGDGNYRVIDHWQWPAALEPDNLLSVRDAFSLQETGHIVDLDSLRRGHDDDGARDRVALDLPQWLLADERAWVLLPLLHMGRMVGIALLHRPLAARALDWEDLDVLRISGRQAASHIAEMQSQAELSEARRFDEFNRRFAFIMHDVKNLASQLGLLAANAERHAENPEFRADMIETLKLSVARMNELLLRLSPQGRSGSVGSSVVKVAPLLQRIAGEAGRRHPVSTGCDDGLEVVGDSDAIVQILGHLVANAIDASVGDAPVLVAASADGDGVRIDVIDHGCGMSREFIRGGLFKPFVSTKDNGFGLGAFEALQLARAMNGRLDVDSHEGEGSRFSLWLPRALPNEAAGRKEQAA
jgi:putative PEP-CTERM system histidine kinase